MVILNMYSLTDSELKFNYSSIPSMSHLADSPTANQSNPECVTGLHEWAYARRLPMAVEQHNI